MNTFWTEQKWSRKAAAGSGLLRKTVECLWKAAAVKHKGKRVLSDETLDLNIQSLHNKTSSCLEKQMLQTEWKQVFIWQSRYKYTHWADKTLFYIKDYFIIFIFVVVHLRWFNHPHSAKHDWLFLQSLSTNGKYKLSVYSVSKISHLIAWADKIQNGRPSYVADTETLVAQ